MSRLHPYPVQVGHAHKGGGGVAVVVVHIASSEAMEGDTVNCGERITPETVIIRMCAECEAILHGDDDDEVAS